MAKMPLCFSLVGTEPEVSLVVTTSNEIQYFLFPIDITQQVCKGHLETSSKLFFNYLYLNEGGLGMSRAQRRSASTKLQYSAGLQNL